MSDPIALMVHATHEAGVKAGGIGAVLDGLLGAPTYGQAVRRTLVVGPMNLAHRAEMERLAHPRHGLAIYYSRSHGIFAGVPESQRTGLQRVEQEYGVTVLYGARRFGPQSHEVILVDASAAYREPVDRFQYYCWEHYGIDSSRHSHNPEYNLYFAVAQPILAAMAVIGAGAGLARSDRFLIAHEWMGMPLVLAAQLNEPDRWSTVFYAHETATARRLVETHSGHDTSFYNALQKAREWNVSLEALYGKQDNYYKHPLLCQAVQCDAILAVSDLVVQELRFLGGRMGNAPIHLAYNGVTVQPISRAEKLASKRKLQDYARNLLGFVPDFVFTHVSRFVLSKGLWRDLRVLEQLEQLLAREDKRAVLFMLATSVPSGRDPDSVRSWEAEYGWPVHHRFGNGDLLDLEASFYQDGVAPFNRNHARVKVVLVNQFGWEHAQCGRRMPETMEFADIRQGTDVEFGQSIYEPFGISQVEALGYGALSCLSNVCGCVEFVRKAAASEEVPHLVVADYVSLPPGYWLGSPYDALAIDQGVRDWIEADSSRRVAQTLFERLPRSNSDLEMLLERGRATAQRMSWDTVVSDYILPAVRRIQRQHARNQAQGNEEDHVN
ncbi:MAG: hypothetical protein H3C34_05515 [Caldilineaceae bacterium]|nr:hypothetical protein [Caldilineaceae bacterium]